MCDLNKFPDLILGFYKRLIWRGEKAPGSLSNINLASQKPKEAKQKPLTPEEKEKYRKIGLQIYKISRFMQGINVDSLPTQEVFKRKISFLKVLFKKFNIDLKDQRVIALLGRQYNRYFKCVAARLTKSPKVLKSISEDILELSEIESLNKGSTHKPNIILRDMILRNKNTDSSTLDHIYKNCLGYTDNAREGIELIAMHPNASNDLLRMMLRRYPIQKPGSFTEEQYVSIVSGILRRLDTSTIQGDVLVDVFKYCKLHKDAGKLMKLIDFQQLTPETLDEMSRLEGEIVKEPMDFKLAIINHANISKKTLAFLSKDNDPFIRLAVAQCFNTSGKVLFALADGNMEKDSEVRNAAIRNLSYKQTDENIGFA